MARWALAPLLLFAAPCFAAPDLSADPTVQRFDLGGQAGLLGDGTLYGIQLRVDLRRFGVDARYDRMEIPAEDPCTCGPEDLHIAQASVTYRLLSGQQGRLRAHLGVYAIFPPGYGFVGPSAGLSATAKVLRLSDDIQFTVEADVQVVVFPFTAVDAHFGPGLTIGPIEARMGLRVIHLDDQGRTDFLPGTAVAPYLGAAMVL